MQQYLDAMSNVLAFGNDRMDRTGTGARSTFGERMKFDLRKTFPAVTSKRLAWKAMSSELLWFIEGSGDEKRLKEILHGSRESEKFTIWTENAEAGYWKEKARYPGDLGRVYGVQWRKWRKYTEVTDYDPYRMYPTSHDRYAVEEVDQLSNLVEGLKKDPFGRRHILTAWNVGELDQMALPPCHMMAQFFVTTEGELSCQMYQRSADMALGVPFNIASYSLFTHMLAKVCGYTPGDFIWVGGDCHIYHNHFDGVKQMLQRPVLELPTLAPLPDVETIFEFKMDDFKLENYNFHPEIKLPMAV